MDRNLYWDTSHPEGDLKFADATFPQWQARGHDRNSLIADPMFVDPARYDFRLKPDSPAFKLGFVPIDTSKIGLYGDSDWVDAPKRIVRETYVPTPPPEPQPMAVEDDFEESLVGIPPEGPTLNVANAGSILVTDEMAVSGKQSLKFTDAPGQTFSFNPHLWYSPRFAAGTIRGSFDVRVEPGAIGHFEWREYSGGDYRVGPSVRIEGDGRILSASKEIGRVPVSEWIHIEIVCALGSNANGQWSLRYGPTGGPLTQLELTCDPKFARLDWVGFIADATVAAAFYVDNLKIEPEESPR